MPILGELQTPSSTSTPVNQQQEEEQAPRSAANWSFARDKTETKDEEDQHQEDQEQDQRSPVAVRFAANSPNPPTSERHVKPSWQSSSRQLLLQRTRNRIRRSSQQQQPILTTESAGNDVAVVVEDAGAVLPDTGGFAQEIECEAAEIRTLIARTAQLWSAVDQAEHSEDAARGSSQRSLRDVSAPALHVSPPAQNVCTEDGNSSGDEEDEIEGEDTETESVNMMLQGTTHFEDYSGSGLHGFRPLVGQVDFEESEHDTSSGSERSREESEYSASENEGLQLEQGEVTDASNQAINASKARVIQNTMLGNLIRLNFREDITRAALEAGVLEIDHYDSDCELAYVDIFISLVKMVCDAHIDVMNESDDTEPSRAPHGGNFVDYEQAGAVSAISPFTFEQQSFLPFKWPVFDMAQFEFGNARPGTCFNSVCVLTNLPKVSMDRTEELMEVLSCNLFCMIGDPIQVVIPSASSTGRTKGHAFLEFDDPDMAQRCALAVDGLTWGRGPFGKIRGNLFRQYQVKSRVTDHRRTPSIGGDEVSFTRSFSSVSGSFPDTAPVPPTYEHGNNCTAKRYHSDFGVAQRQNLLCDSDEDDSDTGEWDVRCPLEYTQFDSSPLLNLPSGNADMREQYESGQHDIAVQLGWGDEALDGEDSMQLRREGEDGNEDDDTFDSNSVLEFQGPNEGKLADQLFFGEFARECAPTRVSSSSGEAQAASSTVTSSISAVAHEFDAMLEQSWDAHEANDAVEKPWRRYCEDLILRNREMQEQIAFARRRVVQLSHNNQKLHLLIDRVERDRDGLLFENDLLQTQLHGYEDHEQHHDILMKELVSLRQRVTQQEQPFDVRSLDLPQQIKIADAPDNLNAASSISHGIQAALSHISSMSLTKCKIEELKEWEQQLENTLSHVRSMKEDKALEMQKKLDRQVEEQNELKLCVICLANEKSVLCLPCRHLCLCKMCSHRQEVIKCPICRLEIDEMLAVYA